jgi:hypothetical protein
MSELEYASIQVKFDADKNPGHLLWSHKAISNLKAFIAGTYTVWTRNTSSVALASLRIIGSTGENITQSFSCVCYKLAFLPRLSHIDRLYMGLRQANYHIVFSGGTIVFRPLLR